MDLISWLSNGMDTNNQTNKEQIVTKDDQIPSPQQAEGGL